LGELSKDGGEEDVKRMKIVEEGFMKRGGCYL